MPNDLDNACTSLWSWIDSWHHEGAYSGPITHAIHGTINFSHSKAVPSYTYEPLIKAFLQYFRITNNPRWRKRALEASEYLVDNLDAQFQFRYSGFEYAPAGGGLVHIVNPLMALMDVAIELEKPEYLPVIRKVLVSSVFFYHDGKGYTGPVNMNLRAIAATSKYGYLTGDWDLYKRYGVEQLDRILSNTTEVVYPEENKIAGAIFRDEHERDIIYPWYNVVKADSLLSIYRYTGEKRCLEVALRALEFSQNHYEYTRGMKHSASKSSGWNFDDKHYVRAPVFLLLNVLHRYEQFLDFTSFEAEILNDLLKMQSRAGYFYGSEGYGIRSLMGVMAWNGFAMEYFSRLGKIPGECKFNNKVEYKNEEYSLVENEEEFTMLLRDKPFYSVSKPYANEKIFPLAYSNYVFEEETSNFTGIHILREESRKYTKFYPVDQAGRCYFPDNYDSDIRCFIPSRRSVSIKKTTDNRFQVYRGKKTRYEKYGKVVYKIGLIFEYLNLLKFVLKVIR